MRVKPVFAWYDFWVGLYWDKSKKRLYILPLPMIGIVIDFDKNHKLFSDEGVELNLWEMGYTDHTKKDKPPFKTEHL